MLSHPMPAPPTPVLLEFDRPGGRPRPYANVYRFEGDGHAPLVFYVGGAISRQTYEARRSTPPTPLAEAFDAARRRLGVGRVDLVICPCPIDTGGLGTEWVLECFDEITTALSTSPTALGCVGYSAGAPYAAHLALLEGAKAAAFYGASGLPSALDALRPALDARVRDGAPPLEAGYFMNDADPLGAAGMTWARPLARAISFATFRGAGSHGFADYAANGFVSDAFAFVLERLGSRVPCG